VSLKTVNVSVEMVWEMQHAEDLRGHLKGRKGALRE
jgi:hypothetical protein